MYQVVKQQHMAHWRGEELVSAWKGASQMIKAVESEAAAQDLMLKQASIIEAHLASLGYHPQVEIEDDALISVSFSQYIDAPFRAYTMAERHTVSIQPV